MRLAPRPARRGARPTYAQRTMKWLRLEQLEDRTVPSGDAILRWNEIAFNAVRADHALDGAHAEPGPAMSSRAMAIIQSAVYDAVESIDHTYAPYEVSVPAAPGASIDAAVAQAAHDTLVALYPTQKVTFDAALADDLSRLPVGPSQAGCAVGRAVAAQMMALRANDGSGAIPNYTFGTQPGQWQVDPLHPDQMVYAADWGSVTPFVIPSADQFDPPPPPPMTSAEYTAAFNEVKNYGGDGVTTPTLRTPEQTEIALFWGYDGQPGLGTPPVHLNQIAADIARQRGNTLVQNARMFALLNLALADAGVVSWDTKYTDNYWRPVTGIRAADTDGNPNTAADPTWAPLGAPADNGNGTNFTPPFPSYSSGHATFAGAAFSVLADFYGTDKISFTAHSDEFNGVTVDQNGQVRPVVTRHFDSFSQAAEEDAQSRIYLGVHWSFDKTEGLSSGKAIANYVFQHALRTEPAAQHFVVGADAGGGPHVRVMDGTTGKALADLLAYDAGFRGGVRVATADVNGDGVPDIITAPGAGGGPHVKVFDGATLKLLGQFMAYDPGFRGGVFVAAGDVNGDGTADIVTGADAGGGPHVKVFDGKSFAVVRSFLAYAPNFTGGVRVAAGDVNGDGLADVVTGAGTGGGPHVEVFDGSTGALLQSFFAYATTFTGGVYVAAGDTNADGKADVVTGAGMGGMPQVDFFDGSGTKLQSFMGFWPAEQMPNGVRVGVADVDGDGRMDVVTGPGPGSSSHVMAVDGVSLLPLDRVTVFDPGFLGGVFVGGLS
jgi:hypothetical protein